MARHPDQPSVARAVKGLQPEQRLAGIAAIVLALTLILPWYEKNFFAPVEGSNKLAAGSDSLNAFQVFSWVEAAVMLISVSVLVLLYQRSRGKAFHLPFGDGTVILAAGAWTLFLLGWRFFDKPDVEGAGATIGINWGIFFALAAAAGVVVAGYRLRAARVPEPPLPGEDHGWVESPRRRDREPHRTPVRPDLAPGFQGARPPGNPDERTAVTDVLGGPPPAWEEPELPEPPSRTPPPPPPPPNAEPAPLPPPPSEPESGRLF